MPSGLSGAELFRQGEGITYSDFTILNTAFSDLRRDMPSLETRLGKGIKLKIPIMASPMDTVTSPELAVALALEGGIAVLHYNHQPEGNNTAIDMQVSEIARVKRWRNGFIGNPVAVSPEMNIGQALERGRDNRPEGDPITTFPVTADGKSDGILVGLLRSTDYFPGERLDASVRDRMLPIDKLVHAQVGITLEAAREKLWEHRIKSLPIVDAAGNLRYLVTRGDIANESLFPLATTDGDGRLRVLFAAETRTETAYERLERGFAAGADGVVVDTSQGHTRFAHDMLKYIAGKYPDKVIIGGNVSTREAASALSKLNYVDAFRCGQGSGSICTTAGTIGVSRAGAVGVYECAGELIRHRRDDDRLVTIADGGIREAGDIVKALAVGAGVVMLGNLLAGTLESPGETIELNGKHVKTYRGMGSAEALKGKQQRGYARHPEGVSGAVPYRGSVHKHVPLLMDAVRHAMEVLNCGSIGELHRKLYNDELRFERRTAGSLAEARPHSLST